MTTLTSTSTLSANTRTDRPGTPIHEMWVSGLLGLDPYEHSTPHEQGGRTCLCEAGPVCRHNHRDKQAPGWHLEHAGARGWFRWTTPSSRSYLSRPTQYPD